MNTPPPSTEEVNEAAKALHDGELVAFATETVYGLGADADQDAAVQKIFKLKGRPNNHPLIVHIAHWASVEHYAHNIPDFAKTLMKTFWPGALTLILHKRPGVAMSATANAESIGLRWPSHPLAIALLRQAHLLGVHGVAAPSANRFGRVSPTRAHHVRDEFGPDLRVLGSSECDIGIESTIIDCTRGQPILLRPGLIDQTALEEALNMPIILQSELVSVDKATRGESHEDASSLGALKKTAPKASGTLASHYAPRARVRLMTASQILTELGSRGVHPISVPTQSPLSSPTSPKTALWVRDRELQAHSRSSDIVIQTMPNNPKESAHALFATLRDFDALGVNEIWIETPPKGSSWAGVYDRLSRASHTDTK